MSETGPIFKIQEPSEPLLSEPVDVEMTDAETAALDALVATTEADLQAAPQPTTIRWSAEQLAVVRRAAERFGMPYQTYVKDAAFRRAIEDLHQLGLPATTPNTHQPEQTSTRERRGSVR